MKPTDVKTSTYIDFAVESNDKDPKFKVGDYLRISKYNNIFANGYTPNWSEGVFVIKKVKNTIPWTYIISNFKDEEIAGTFYKNCKRLIKQSLELKSNEEKRQQIKQERL